MVYQVFDCTTLYGVTLYIRTRWLANLAAAALTRLTGRMHDYTNTAGPVWEGDPPRKPVLVWARG